MSDRPSLFFSMEHNLLCAGTAARLPAVRLIGGDVQSSACAVPLPNPSITLYRPAPHPDLLSHTSDQETPESPALPVPYGRPTAAPFVWGWGCRLDSGRMQFPWHCHRAPTVAVAWTPAGRLPADSTIQPDHDGLTQCHMLLVLLDAFKRHCHLKEKDSKIWIFNC